MKRLSQIALAVILYGFLSAAHAGPIPIGPDSAPAQSAKAPPGVELAQAVSMITGVAISPLLGVGTVGAWKYFATPPERRAALPWFAHPHFWIPALLLVGLIGLKDLLGTAMPPPLKKPFDVLEVIENKISGLVAIGAFVPLVASVFAHAVGDGASTRDVMGFGSACLATIDAGTVGNLLLVPLAMLAFAFVWLTSHTINILILLSPWGVLDAALKSSRIFLMSLVAGVTYVYPYAGAALSLIIIIISYFLAGWSFRLMVFGWSFAWDFLTLRHLRFQPRNDANWTFTAEEIDNVPVRTYGRLTRNGQGKLKFEYRPWLFLPGRTLELPTGSYEIGRGLFYSQVMLREREKENPQSLLLLPPRYRTHEEALVRIYEMGEVRDVGLRHGFKAVWAWIKNVSGFHGNIAPQSAAPA